MLQPGLISSNQPRTPPQLASHLVKGPGLRANLDVRRVWRCPRCGRVARTPGAVTAVRCGCGDETWMQLQPPVKREPFRPPPRTPEQIAEDRADEVEDDELPAEESPIESTQPDTPVRGATEAPASPDASSEPAPVTPAIGVTPAPVDSGGDPPASESKPEPDSFGEGIPNAE
jgi:hypothetical protein